MGELIGYVACAIAVVFFGTNFVPVKKFETGDGLFFQWIMCSAIWVAGLIVYLIRLHPTFHPVAMLGGVLWVTGNVTVVPIVKMIGLGLGLLTWGLSSMLTGWIVANFGLFGIKSEAMCGTEAKVLNYVGAAVAVAAMVPYAFLQTNTSTAEDQAAADEHIPLNAHPGEIKPLRLDTGNDDEQGDFFERLSPSTKKAIGFPLAIVAGVLYGTNFDPPQYLKDHGYGSDNNLDYVFPHFSGIFLGSTVYFLLYCVLRRNNPRVFPRAILPAIVCGSMWAVAQICYFVANEKLSMVVAFPIISTGPGVVGALWGLLVFREISGSRNLMLLGGAFLLTAVGIVLITLSKMKSTCSS